MVSDFKLFLACMLMCRVQHMGGTGTLNPFIHESACPVVTQNSQKALEQGQVA